MGKRQSPTTPTDDLLALKVATREAHEVLQDLRRLVATLENLRNGVPERVHAEFEQHLQHGVDESMRAIGDATLRAIDAAEKRITDRFEMLGEIMMGNVQAEKGEEESFADLLERYVATHGPLVTLKEGS